MTASTTPETTSRRVVANITLSLDGRVNGPGGDADMGWIVPHALTDEARDHMVAVTSPATTALLGRKNYEGFAGFWPGVADDETADPRDRAFSRWLNAADKVVFARSPHGATWPNSTIATASPSDTVAGLRQEKGGDIVVLSSRSVIRDLLAADAIDRLSITLCPEMVGGGDRLFDDVDLSANWRLVSSTSAASGAICLLYDRAR
jgi:dihydrofolate reductase